jgi:hypothetical protein
MSPFFNSSMSEKEEEDDKEDKSASTIINIEGLTEQIQSYM